MVDEWWILYLFFNSDGSLPDIAVDNVPSYIYLQVIAALAETMKKGTSFGAPCLLQNTLGVEMVRSVNSGTECMRVLRLARAFTDKERIIKFEGCYHGHDDPFLVKVGSGVATLGLPDSPAVPKEATNETLTAPFNDISAVEYLWDQ